MGPEALRRLGPLAVRGPGCFARLMMLLVAPRVFRAPSGPGGVGSGYPPHRRQGGFCSIRRWLAACRRRVTPLMTPFPPFGGGQVPTGGGVAAKLQTTSANNADNGLL